MPAVGNIKVAKSKVKQTKSKIFGNQGKFITIASVKFSKYNSKITIKVAMSNVLVPME